MSELKKFPRGAKPCPRHKLAGALPFRTAKGRALPSVVAYIPPKLSMWGNDQYGDCVTAEEAYNKSVSGKFFSDYAVIAWARNNGFLDGADLTDVMVAMNKAGFVDGSNIYGDGPEPLSVDYSNEPILQAAIAIAPVKIGIDADALGSGAGNQSGWTSFGGTPQEFTNEDHCVSLGGYGSVAALCQALGVAVPSGVDSNKQCYLLFTWSTLGLVDHDWLMSTCGEAWLRNPSTMINGVAQPNPGPVVPPPAPPTPPVPPVPPAPVSDGLPWYVWAAIGLGSALAVGLVVLILKK